MIRPLLLTNPLSRWVQMLFLAFALAAGASQTRAQMTGEFAGDLAIVSSALKATIAATAKDDADASRVAMEELYRQWRVLRSKNFEAQAADPLFIPEMEKVEARLFAASKLIDKGEWLPANNELLMAEKILQSVQLRQPGIAKPIAGYSRPDRSSFFSVLFISN
jgi:hypothetical protein